MIVLTDNRCTDVPQGRASLATDPADSWTTRIRTKHITDEIAPGVAERDLGRARVLITVTPSQITAVASV